MVGISNYWMLVKNRDVWSSRPTPGVVGQLMMNNMRRTEISEYFLACVAQRRARYLTLQ